MKDVNDMTLREIDSLQSQYRKEFVEVVEKFLEERPMIERIWLFEDGILTTHSSSLRVNNIHKIVSKVYLKGVKL